MTDKELHKLSKPQLIEILYYLSKENDELKAENQQLKDRLDALVGEAIAAKKETIAESEPVTKPSAKPSKKKKR